MESPNLDKYMNLRLEIRTAQMHFLAMDTIEIRCTKSPYLYVFTLIDMLTNYMLTIPVKDISRKTVVQEYIYKVYLPFRHMDKFLSKNITRFINEDQQNLVNALSFKYIQCSPQNPRANGKIENVQNFLKCTRKIMHGNSKMSWHGAIQFTTHFHTMFPSSSNGHSPFLLYFGGEDSNLYE